MFLVMFSLPLSSLLLMVPDFHVVRSALENSQFPTWYIFADQVFFRSYVLRHIDFWSFAV